MLHSTAACRLQRSIACTVWAITSGGAFGPNAGGAACPSQPAKLVTQAARIASSEASSSGPSGLSAVLSANGSCGAAITTRAIRASPWRVR